MKRLGKKKNFIYFYEETFLNLIQFLSKYEWILMENPIETENRPREIKTEDGIDSLWFKRERRIP